MTVDDGAGHAENFGYELAAAEQVPSQDLALIEKGPSFEVREKNVDDGVEFVDDFVQDPAAIVEQVPSWEPVVIEQPPSFEVPDRNAGDGAVLGLARQVPTSEVRDKNVDDDDDLARVPPVPPSEVHGMNFGDDDDLAGEEQVPEKSAVVHYCTLVESFVAVGLALAPTREHH